MKFQKNDNVDEFKVLLPLKNNGTIETYRVRGNDGLLYALKYGANAQERKASRLSGLYAGSGCDYVVYRYVSGESLQDRLKRRVKCEPYEARRFAMDILAQLKVFHDAGYTHSALSADNIMIDLANGQPKAWVIGLSSVIESTFSSPTTDAKSVGALIYHMVFGESVEEPVRIRAGASADSDIILLNVMYKALASGFSSAKEMSDALEGREDVGKVRMLSGDGFAAVAGMDDIKKRLQEDVIDVLEDIDGAKAYGLNIPNGMLLYGPPGCGKTFIAEKFSEQAGYNYRYVKSSDLASTYLHGSQEKIAALFEEARRGAPTILCFDEFDALVPKRDDVHNAGHSAEVNEFLSQMNNCGSDGVFVIATTNRPDKIDQAILRTGRIDYMVYVPVPDKETREAMFELALKGRPVAADVDYRKLSLRTEGYLTSDIAAVVNDAARIAFRKKVKITMGIISEVLSLRKPSMTKEAIKEYESLRLMFEGVQKERSRIGFK